MEEAMKNDFTQEEEPRDLKGVDQKFYTLQGNARAVAASEGAKATVNQIIVQNRTVVIAMDSDPGLKNLKVLGQQINMDIDQQGNFLLNGTKVDANNLGEGIKMFVFNTQDILKDEATTSKDED